MSMSGGGKVQVGGLMDRQNSCVRFFDSKWWFDHGIVIKRERKNAGKKQEIPKMIALTRAHISERFLILASSMYSTQRNDNNTLTHLTKASCQQGCPRSVIHGDFVSLFWDKS